MASSGNHILIVVWTDNSVTMIPEQRLYIPDGLAVGNIVKRQNNNAMWEGKIDSFWPTKAAAKNRYAKLCPPKNVFTESVVFSSKRARKPCKKMAEAESEDEEDASPSKAKLPKPIKSPLKAKIQKVTSKNQKSDSKNQKSVENVNQILKETQFLQKLDEKTSTPTIALSSFEEEDMDLTILSKVQDIMTPICHNTVPGGSPKAKLNAKGHPTVAGKEPRKKFLNQSTTQSARIVPQESLKAIDSTPYTPVQEKKGSSNFYYKNKKTCKSCEDKDGELHVLNNKILTLTNENMRLQAIIDTGEGYVDNSPPKSGILPKSVAQRYNMEELVEKSGVFVTQEQIQILSTKASQTASALFLLDVFYSRQEQIEMNLTGANNRVAMNPSILSAIIAYCLSKSGTDDMAKLKVALRNKLAQALSRHRLSNKEN